MEDEKVNEIIALEAIFGRVSIVNSPIEIPVRGERYESALYYCASVVLLGDGGCYGDDAISFELSYVMSEGLNLLFYIEYPASYPIGLERPIVRLKSSSPISLLLLNVLVGSVSEIIRNRCDDQVYMFEIISTVISIFESSKGEGKNGDMYINDNDDDDNNNCNHDSFIPTLDKKISFEDVDDPFEGSDVPVSDEKLSDDDFSSDNSPPSYYKIKEVAQHSNQQPTLDPSTLTAVSGRHASNFNILSVLSENEYEKVLLAQHRIDLCTYVLKAYFLNTMEDITVEDIDFVFAALEFKGTKTQTTLKKANMILNIYRTLCISNIFSIKGKKGSSFNKSILNSSTQDNGNDSPPSRSRRISSCISSRVPRVRNSGAKRSTSLDPIIIYKPSRYYRVTPLRRSDIRTRSNQLAKTLILNVETFSRLQHPFLIRYHQCWKEEDCIYIQREHCPGKTLLQEINDKTLIEATTIWLYFRQILEVLVYLHCQSIIHRAIKPSNIYICHDNFGSHIKVGGFGMDSFLRRVRSGEGEGIIEGELHSEKSDVFCLGLVFFEMWCGGYENELQRSRVLTNLVRYNIFPIGFRSRLPEAVINIINLLISTNPPTTVALLNNNSIPPAVDRNTLKHFLNRVIHPSTHQSADTMRILFARASQGVDYSTAAAFFPRPRSRVQGMRGVRDRVLMSLEDFFVMQGAIESETAPFGSNCKSSRMEKLLTKNNKLLVLQLHVLPSLTSPRFCRYSVGRGFFRRQRLRAGESQQKAQYPLETTLVTYATPVCSRLGSRQVEVILTAIDAITSILKTPLKLRTRWTIHHFLFDLLQTCCGLTADCAEKFVDWFSQKQPDSVGLEDLRTTLNYATGDEGNGKLITTSLKQLQTLLNFRGPFQGIVPKLRRFVQHPKPLVSGVEPPLTAEDVEKIEKVLDEAEEMSKMLEVAERTGVQIVFGLTLGNVADIGFERGCVCFEILCPTIGSCQSGDVYSTISRELVAQGGVVKILCEGNVVMASGSGYEGIEEYTYMMGFEISLERLTALAMDEYKSQRSLSNISEETLLTPQILVTTQTWRLHPKAFALTNTLLHKGFGAELRYLPLIDSSKLIKNMQKQSSLSAYVSVQAKGSRALQNEIPKGSSECAGKQDTRVKGDAVFIVAFTNQTTKRRFDSEAGLISYLQHMLSAKRRLDQSG